MKSHGLTIGYAETGRTRFALLLSDAWMSYQERLGFVLATRDQSRKEEREFLFDFTAFILDNEPGFADWYTMQALIVGEIEFNGDLGRDFEKLMFADSAVCFFVFPDAIKEHRPVDELDFFSKVAQKRIRPVSARCNVPPVFVIASYSGEHRRFMTRVIRHEPH